MQFLYLDRIHELLSCIEQEETGAMEACVELLAKCVMDHHSIYTFGASHAGILSEELYYRAGGLMLFNPIFARERCVGYGTQIANSKVSFQEGDVLIIHSVSGRNPVSIEIAMEAKKHHAKVIAITNLAYSKSVSSRHPSGKRLFELADLILDNHGDIGDACVSISGLEQKVSPTSTVAGAVMLNAIVAALARLVDLGMKTPPIFYSANLDGGDAKNEELYQAYRSSIHYSF